MSAFIRKNRRYIMYTCVTFMLLLFILPIATRVRVSEGESYQTARQVAAYLMQFERLPDNYLLGEGEERPQDGKYFGGMEYAYEGKITEMTEEKVLYYCDVSYSSSSPFRGDKKLVYTADGKQVFYTTNGGESFIRMTSRQINIVSNSFGIAFCVLVGLELIALLAAFATKDKADRKEYFDEVGEVLQNTFVVLYSFVIFPFYFVYLGALWVYNRMAFRKKKG